MMETEIDDQTPIYLHDCSSCIYLGRSTYQPASWMEKKAADVYFCVGTQNHIGEEACILVRWQPGSLSFSYFPYFVFYLLRYNPKKDGNKALLNPYLWGLEQAKRRGLLAIKTNS